VPRTMPAPRRPARSNPARRARGVAALLAARRWGLAVESCPPWCSGQHLGNPLPVSGEVHGGDFGERTFFVHDDAAGRTEIGVSLDAGQTLSLERAGALGDELLAAVEFLTRGQS
jgi:hypothetical protein